MLPDAARYGLVACCRLSGAWRTLVSQSGRWGLAIFTEGLPPRRGRHKGRWTSLVLIDAAFRPIAVAVEYVPVVAMDVKDDAASIIVLVPGPPGELNLGDPNPCTTPAGKRSCSVFEVVESVGDLGPGSIHHNNVGKDG